MMQRQIQRGRKFLGTLYDDVRALAPGRRRAARATMESRRDAIALLDDWSRKELSGAAVAERVLIDGMWDNANYWIRYALLRRALNLSGAQETGLLGENSRALVTESFARLGITDLVDYHAQNESLGPNLTEARRLLAETRSAADMLAWSLPYGFPAALLYDGVLKRQRRATVDLSDPLLVDIIAVALTSIEVSDQVVEQGAYELVVMSHSINYTYAALAWAAIRRHIPVLILYGQFGTVRFIHLTEPSDIFAFPGSPGNDEIDGMPAAASHALERLGGAQLESRLKGHADDVGSVYAYKFRQAAVDRQALCETYGWDPARPVIAVYAPNWFDYPHACGLHEFQDFLEWIEETMAVAAKCEQVNWLFKTHPCDDWYPEIKGPRLDDMINQANHSHMRLVDISWNGHDLIQCLDGIITCHGTIGLEAVSQGTPVLTAYTGWYGHAGFSITPGDREGYIAALGSPWWEDWDANAAMSRARLFAGWYFCLPDWHGGYIFRDDSAQEANFIGLAAFLADNADAIGREIQTLHDWYQSGHAYYHVFKISQAEGFQTTDLAKTSSSTSPVEINEETTEQVVG